MGTVVVASNVTHKESGLVPEDTLRLEEVGITPKLQNSDILSNVDQKLNHLPMKEKEVIKALILEYTTFFPNVPGKTVMM